VQVKTNATTFSFWLLSQKSKEIVSKNHIYVLVNLRPTNEGEIIEYYVVPSKVIAKKMIDEIRPKSKWHFFQLKEALPYKDKWATFDRAM